MTSTFKELEGTIDWTKGARDRGGDVPAGGYLVELKHPMAAKALVAEVRKLGKDWGLKFHQLRGHPEGWYMDYWYDGAWKATYGTHGTSAGTFVVPEWFVAGHVGACAPVKIGIGKGFGFRHYPIVGKNETLKFMRWIEVLFDVVMERYEVNEGVAGKMKQLLGSMAFFMKPRNNPFKEHEVAEAEVAADDDVDMRATLWQCSPGGVMSADGHVDVSSFDRGHFTVRMGGEVILVGVEHGPGKSVSVWRSADMKAQGRKGVRVLDGEEKAQVFALMETALPLMGNVLEILE